MSADRLGPVYGTGMKYEASPDVDRIPPYDPRSGDHFWIIPVAFRTDPSTWDPSSPVHLDMENLVFASGAGCYYCEQPYEPRLLRRRCPGEPR